MPACRRGLQCVAEVQLPSLADCHHYVNLTNGIEALPRLLELDLPYRCGGSQPRHQEHGSGQEPEWITLCTLLLLIIPSVAACPRMQVPAPALHSLRAAAV